MSPSLEETLIRSICLIETENREAERETDTEGERQRMRDNFLKGLLHDQIKKE